MVKHLKGKFKEFKLKIMHLNRIFGLFVVLLFAINSSAQNDSLILKNNNVIIGEIKSMNRSVVIIETDYSDSDFKVEWGGIKEIYTEQVFIINVVGGELFTGRIKTTAPEIVSIIGSSENNKIHMDSIVYLDKYGNDFLSNFYASFGLGMNLTKANDFTQFSLNLSAGYLAKKWSLDMYFNSLNSTQDEIDDIKRSDAGLEYRFLLPKNWYLAIAADFLSNTEQAIALRSNTRLGVGYFPIKNNKLYWGIGAGANTNLEKFSNDSPNRQSLEAYIGSEINLFNINDFSLLSNIYVFPSLTEAGRLRIDYMLNTKYDLPLDFYIGLNFSLNYDNRPGEIGKETDYIFGASFGWSW